jgi:hypothetical protein
MLVSCLAHLLTLNTEPKYSFKISVDFQQTTRCYIPRDRALQYGTTSTNIHILNEIRTYPIPWSKTMGVVQTFLTVGLNVKVALFFPLSVYHRKLMLQWGPCTSLSVSRIIPVRTILCNSPVLCNIWLICAFVSCALCQSPWSFRSLLPGTCDAR